MVDGLPKKLYSRALCVPHRVRLLATPRETGWNWWDVAGVVEHLPALEGEWQVAVDPEPKSWKVLEFEGFALFAAGVGEHADDVELADLIGDGLAGCGCEHGGLAACCAHVHRYGGGEVVGGLLEGELAECETDVYLYAEGAETHHAVDVLLDAWGGVEEAGLKHHLFGVEAYALVGFGVVVVATDGVGIAPTPGHLERSQTPS